MCKLNLGLSQCYIFNQILGNNALKDNYNETHINTVFLHHLIQLHARFSQIQFSEIRVALSLVTEWLS